jgi:hypothetical protein
LFVQGKSKNVVLVYQLSRSYNMMDFRTCQHHI